MRLFDADVNDSPPSRLTRRRFLAAGLATMFLTGRGRATSPLAPPLLGLCGSIEQSTMGGDAGLSFIEINLKSTCAPEVTEAEFEKWRAVVRNAALPASHANGFFPGELKLVGPQRDLSKIRDYAEASLARAAKAGVKIVTLGSGGSRQAPEGTSVAQAVEQFTECGREIAAIARRHGLTIAVEPLNRKETNVLNRLADVCAVVDAVNAPNFGATADIYHMLVEREGAEALEAAGARVRHCHLAEDEGRRPPGTAGEDFTAYFRALASIHYTGAISLECRWKDQSAELPGAVAEVTRQWRRAAA
jgi:sugar phosphate isomerase/epimerase